MDLIKSINEMAMEMKLSPDLQDIARRLAEFWRQRADSMTEDELSEAIGMDMENVPGVDGDPEVVDKLIPIVMSMVRGG
jgi:hypothetical protein